MNLFEIITQQGKKFSVAVSINKTEQPQKHPAQKAMEIFHKAYPGISIKECNFVEEVLA